MNSTYTNRMLLAAAIEQGRPYLSAGNDMAVFRPYDGGIRVRVKGRLDARVTEGGRLLLRFNRAPTATIQEAVRVLCATYANANLGIVYKGERITLQHRDGTVELPLNHWLDLSQYPPSLIEES